MFTTLDAGIPATCDASRWVPVNPTGKTQPTQLRRPPRKSLRALKKDAMGVELPRSLKSVMLPSIGFVPLAGPTGTRPCRSETWQGGMLSTSFTSWPAMVLALSFQLISKKSHTRKSNVKPFQLLLVHQGAFQYISMSHLNIQHLHRFLSPCNPR